MKLFAHTLLSPIADVFLAADEDGALTHLYFIGKRSQADILERIEAAGDEVVWDAPRLRPAIQQLEEYFAGRRRDFDLPLRGRGTDFQERVWRELCNIPYGETISYGELAQRIGSPQASRAVGSANGQNPISLVVPCHRVIGANGKLTGYGGGLPTKQALLDFERGQRSFAPTAD